MRHAGPSRGVPTQDFSIDSDGTIIFLACFEGIGFMTTPQLSIKRLFLGKPDANSSRYLAVVTILSVALFGVSYWYLYEGWWSGGGPTVALLVMTMFIAVVAGYEQYGILSCIAGAFLPIFALLLRGEYITSTMEYPSSPPPTPAEHVAQSVVFAIAPAILVGVLGYALGYGLRLMRERTAPTSSAV